MIVQTIQKNISTSPRKLRLVADMVRKMSPEQALLTLEFTQNAASLPLSKAIKTVLANAKGSESLSFKSIEINEGMKLKRYRVGTAGRGRGRSYKKRTSQIKIILTDEQVQKNSEKLRKTVSQRVKKVEKVEEKGESIS